MEEYQMRVVQEKAELDERIMKLKRFINNVPAFGVDSDDMSLLRMQLNAMRGTPTSSVTGSRGFNGHPELRHSAVKEHSECGKRPQEGAVGVCATSEAQEDQEEEDEAMTTKAKEVKETTPKDKKEAPSTKEAALQRFVKVQK